MISRRKNIAGFTMVELLASITIITIITGIFLTNYYSTNKRSELKITAQKLVSDIRLAQSYSLGLTKFSGSMPAGGWGIYLSTLEPNSYIIMADINSPDGNQSYDGDGELYKQVDLPSRISVDRITNDSGEIAQVSITFYPPDPVVYINGADDDTVNIRLKENIGDSTITISTNYFGLVDIVD